MEANKENISEKMETRIPLPLHPLPPLPIQLLKKKGINIEKRQPLQTLAQENVIPTTSNVISSQEKSMTKLLKKLDTKFITMRRKVQELDTDYNIFKDHEESIIIISDDDEGEETERNIKDGTFFDGAKQRDDRLTPSEKQGQHLQVRNIKRSLKRPSSRELQGLSPPDKQEKRQEATASLAVKRRLRFTETPPDRFQSTDSWIKAYMGLLDQVYAEDLLNHLLATERPPSTAAAIPRLTRACLIDWLLRVNGPLGNTAIVQSACWYLDSILSSETVPLHKIQLVAMACYWIAQKLHGPAALSSRYARISGFTQMMLTNAEKLILMKLGFPPQPVIPQEFIAYLAWWCDKDRPGEIEVAANFLCMSGLMVVKELGAVYPSVVACAAIATAITILRGKDAVKRIQDCPIYKTAKKKAGSLLHTCDMLRNAVRTVADPRYQFKEPMKHYGGPAYFITQHIVESVRQCQALPVFVQTLI